MKIFWFFLILPFAAIAQTSQVITYLDGDWNGDGAPDRAFLMGFDNSDYADVAIYLGNPATGEQTLTAHMEDAIYVATTAGQPSGSAPVFAAVGRNGFRLITENTTVGERATHTIRWNGSAFVVSSYMREVFNSEHPEQGFTCVADYSTRKASFTITGSSNGDIFDLPNGEILLENWSLTKIPEYCLGF